MAKVISFPAAADAGRVLPDKQMMIEAVRLLHPGRPVELRVLNVDGRGQTASGYFDQPLKLAEAALRYDRRAEGVYITLNPIPVSLLGRANNTLRERAKTTTSDAEVLRRAYLPLDLDPARPSGISSSEAEHQAALDQARRVREWLAAELGWHAPLFADSGNGAHLLYALDLPNDAESTHLLKRCLAALARRFDTPEVKLDQSVYNAARIWKLYGSLARKGESLPERPHRLARLIETPDPLGLVTREQLEALANEIAPWGVPPPAENGSPDGARGIPEEGPGTTAPGGNFNRQAGRVSEDDLRGWLEAHGAVIWQTKRDGGRVIFVLERCPFNPAHHEPGKACVTLNAEGAGARATNGSESAGTRWQPASERSERECGNPVSARAAPRSGPQAPAAEGALGFKCQAAGCAGHHWQDLKALWGDGPARGQTGAQTPEAAAETPAPGQVLSPEAARARLAIIAPTMRRLDALLAQEFSPTLWVVPDLLPEGLTLLAAKPKLGKSWLALGLALAVASGGVALGKVQVKQGDVLYLALEDSLKRIHQRSKQLLRGQPAPAALEVDTSCPRLDEGGLGLLEVWLQAHPVARLIILDTFAKVRGQTRSATLYGDDYASLEPVQALAHRHSVGILVIHHTGKESREDPLDEVNATQGLNGVADNILVLRRERGKPQATLIGDGRELNGVELTLQFDATSGAWTQVEAPPADQPKTPERAEILALLKASDGPLSRKQISEALGKNGNTISTILARMVRDGDIKMAGYAKYIPVNSVNGVNTSPLKESKKNIPALFEEGSSSVATVLTVLTPPQEPDPDPVEESGEAPPPEAPPEEFLRFAHMVAEITHSRLDEASIRQVPAAPQQSSLDDYLALARPDAHDPYTLQPSGLRPASLAKAPAGSLWPIYGDCTGVFCQGECVCGEHVCNPCGCEAGALIDNHPWYFERHAARRGAICEYCYAPATVASRWQTPMCERCWQIASRGQGIDPRRYQPRPFGPIEGDEEEEEEAPVAGG